ncbi:MAG: hypothetical protein KF843_14230 [Flavobacteriales bacterium]|nr:hypothetical protein [Flavobacteriales bacterium]
MTKKRITKEELLKIEKAAVREERKDQGALDGRFREKVEKSKKTYTRKTKHKKKEPKGSLSDRRMIARDR